jgi:hypothetical protein
LAPTRPAAVPNPLRSEAAAFRLFLYVIAVVIVIVVVAAVVRAVA